MFSSRRSAWLALNQPLGSEVFEETSGTFCTIWSRKVCFQKGIVVFITVSWTFFTC